MIKKLFCIGLVFVMIFTVFTIAGCSNRKPFDVDGWTLANYRVHNPQDDTWSTRVNVISANAESLVENGSVNIPAKIGKYNIYGLGLADNMFEGKGFWFTVEMEAKIDRIVIAEEIYVDDCFWKGIKDSVNTIEFLSSDFLRVDNLLTTENRGNTYIIPDGSTQNFLERYGLEDLEFDNFTVIEKSNYLGGSSDVFGSDGT